MTHASPLAGRDLISLADWSGSDITRVLDAASHLKRDPARWRGALDAKAVVMLFEKPSLRTRVSFEVGIAKCGGHAMYFDHASSKIGERESIKDYAMNLERWVECIVARTYRHETVTELARHARVPVVNALTDLDHPCQALADMLTLRERVGDLRRARLAYIGDGNNVCHALMHACAALGTRLTIITPEGYEPRADVLAQARRTCAASGGTIELARDPRAVEGHQAIRSTRALPARHRDRPSRSSPGPGRGRPKTGCTRLRTAARARATTRSASSRPTPPSPRTSRSSSRGAIRVESLRGRDARLSQAAEHPHHRQRDQDLLARPQPLAHQPRGRRDRGPPGTRRPRTRGCSRLPPRPRTSPRMSRSPSSRAPRRAQRLEDDRGWQIIEKLNAIGGAHGVGRVDLVENRRVGMKSRGSTKPRAARSSPRLSADRRTGARPRDAPLSRAPRAHLRRARLRRPLVHAAARGALGLRLDRQALMTETSSCVSTRAPRRPSSSVAARTASTARASRPSAPTRSTTSRTPAASSVSTRCRRASGLSRPSIPSTAARPARVPPAAS
jgi:ornithine carbamoyltransferase